MVSSVSLYFGSIIVYKFVTTCLSNSIHILYNSTYQNPNGIEEKKVLSSRTALSIYFPLIVRERVPKLLLATINPIGRFIESCEPLLESYVLLSTFADSLCGLSLMNCSLSLMNRSPRLPIDNIIAFVPFSTHSIVPCNFPDMWRNQSRLDFFCGWHPLPSHHRPHCAIPCQRARVVHTGLEPVITTLKEW